MLSLFTKDGSSEPAGSDSSRGSAADQKWADKSQASNIIFNATQSLLRIDPGGDPGKPALVMDGKDYQEYLKRADEAFTAQQQKQASPPQ